MRKLSAVILAFLAAIVLATTAGAAPPFRHATGSVGLSDPLQYASFNAFDYGASGDRGHITYTNFEYFVPGTGVWNVEGTYPLIVTLGASVFPHTMIVDTITPISPTATTFSGHGSSDTDPSITWTVTGVVSGSNISFTLLYTGTLAGYTFSAVGTIAPDGSMSGTATDSQFNSPLTWSVPAGSVAEVFSYTAAITCADVGDTDATFSFAIPPDLPLAGTPVVVQIHDGGSPGTNGDTWAHGVASGPCAGSVTAYPIVSGNLVVH